METISRAEIGLKAPTRTTHLTSPQPISIQHHGGDKAATPATLEMAKSRWRAYQNQHMGVQGWTDIAYNHGVTQTGHILDGRGWGHQSGATGSPYDAQSYSLCAVGNFERDMPSSAMLEAIAQWLNWGADLGHLEPLGTLQRGYHQQFASTACPGRHLINAHTSIGARAMQIHLRTPPQAPPSAIPGFVIPIEARVASLEQRMRRVEEWQDGRS